MTESEYQAVAALIESQKTGAFVPFKYSLGLTAAACNLLRLLEDAYKHFGLEFAEHEERLVPVGIAVSTVLKAIGVSKTAISNAALFVEHIIREINSLSYLKVFMAVDDENPENENIIFRVLEFRYDLAAKKVFKPLILQGWDKY